MDEKQKKQFFREVHIGDLLNIDYRLENIRVNGGVFGIVQMLDTEKVVIGGKDPLNEIPTSGTTQYHVALGTIAHYYKIDREEYIRELNSILEN